jgi:hypothetical protein
MPRSEDIVPHHIMIAPLAAIYTLLTAVCGIEAAALVLGAAGIFAVLAYAFVPDGPPRGDTQAPVRAADTEREHRSAPPDAGRAARSAATRS